MNKNLKFPTGFTGQAQMTPVQGVQQNMLGAIPDAPVEAMPLWGQPGHATQMPVIPGMAPQTGPTRQPPVQMNGFDKWKAHMNSGLLSGFLPKSAFKLSIEQYLRAHGLIE